MTINVNPLVLEQVSAALMSMINEIEQERSNLIQARNDTLAVWNSQHTHIFESSVNGTHRAIGRTIEDIRQVANKLRSTATEVRVLEQRIRDIKKGII